MDDDPRIKLNVFEGKTTYTNDFRKFTPDKREKYSWPKDRTERPQKKQREFNRKDPETFITWHKNVYVPFDLMIKARPIIDTSPYTPVPRMKEADDAEKEQVMKTRPRLYTSPAVSIDDVPDPEMRKLLLQHMYTTDFRRAAKEGAASENNREIALSTIDRGGDPLTLRTQLNPPLPPGWRERGKAWDNKQKRALVDATETFWLKKSADIKCGACTNPYKGAIPQEMKDKIANLINKDTLRLPHDYSIPGYTGFKPMLSGAPLAKTELPVTHPFLSAAQAITQRYADDKHA